MNMNFDDIVPVRFTEGKLLLLDQTRLPGEEVYIEMETKEDVWDAIYKLKVRGAPAIGVAAAYGLYISVRDLKADTAAEFAAEVREIADYLNSSRPTAVNLSWALNRMERVCLLHRQERIASIIESLKEEAILIQQEDIDSRRSNGYYAPELRPRRR